MKKFGGMETEVTYVAYYTEKPVFFVFIYTCKADTCETVQSYRFLWLLWVLACAEGWG